jgi:DNA polymerase III epsilon subunit
MSAQATYPLAFLDVETTGLSPWFGDRVCEIAVVRAQGDDINTKFQTLVNPDREISPRASQVNGLTDEDVRDAPRFTEIAEKVEALLDDAVIVCHNAPFDLAFIDSEFSQLGKTFAAPQLIDTLSLARQYFNFASNSLGALASDLDIPTPNAHRALGDALTTRQVFLAFIDEIQARGQIQQLEDIISSYVPAWLSPEEVMLPPLVEEALTLGRPICITYADRNGQQTERWITPRQVLVANEYLYLAAHCHLRDAKRHFRLDRIVKIETN